MDISPPPGVQLDAPRVTAAPSWATGLNIRFRLGYLETIGLFGPLRLITGDQVVLPGSASYRKMFTTPSQTEGQILAGSTTNLTLIDFDDASTPATGTRWKLTDVTPTVFPLAADELPAVSTGRVNIPPVWWFSDQDDIVVGSRAGVFDEPCYYWDRSANRALPLPNSPLGAVGGGITDRILILLGCTSSAEPDPQRYMTIRWSDRFDFTEWENTDLTVSGELQLEGGSRIVGGGVTGFGVVAWTDRRMALLTETGDIGTVFARRYIDGGRGLLANNAWTEADGQLFWYDEHRVLNIFDGGRPRQVPNPIKYGTIERLDDRQTARAYLTPNPEFGEVILHYPGIDQTEPDQQLVYNYMLDAWSPWSLQRGAYSTRFGVIRPLGVDENGLVWQHELDASLPNTYIQGPVPPEITFPYANTPAVAAISADDVEPFSAFVLTNLISTESVTSQTWNTTRILADHLPSPATGAETDPFLLVVNGYGESSPVIVGDRLFQDHQWVVQGEDAKDVRVEGKALQIGLYMTDIKTVFRFSKFAITANPAGER